MVKTSVKCTQNFAQNAFRELPWVLKVSPLQLLPLCLLYNSLKNALTHFLNYVKQLVNRNGIKLVICQGCFAKICKIDLIGWNSLVIDFPKTHLWLDHCNSCSTALLAILLLGNRSWGKCHINIFGMIASRHHMDHFPEGK